MSPEQVEGQRGDQRTDIYAVGIMMYELLTGSAPFSGDNNLAIMSQHLNASIPRLDKKQAGVSTQLAAFVAKCVQRDPKERFGNMHELVNALDNLNGIDITILDKISNPTGKIPFWRTPVAIAVGSALILMVVIIIIAFVLQSLR